MKRGVEEMTDTSEEASGVRRRENESRSLLRYRCQFSEKCISRSGHIWNIDRSIACTPLFLM